MLANKVQQTLLRQAQLQLLRQAQQSLPNWPNIYKLASGYREGGTSALLLFEEEYLYLRLCFWLF